MEGFNDVKGSGAKKMCKWSKVECIMNVFFFKWGCEAQESFGKVPVAVHFYKNHALPRRSYEAFFQIGETFQFQWGCH